MQVVFVLYAFATLIQGRHIKDTNIKKLLGVILDDIDEVKNTLKHENDEEHLSIYEVNKRLGLTTDEKSPPVNDDILAKRYVDASLHWLNQVQQGGPQYIPYVIESSDGSDVVGRIQSFIDSFNAQFSTACQRNLWQPHSTEQYYVKIQTHEDGCWSYVGNVARWVSTNPYQPLNLQALDCLYEATVHHEMMHAMGFHHEQNRCDRDAYVEILTQNIDPNNLHNYDKEDASATQFYSKYDYFSVMHYADYFYSNGQPTMRYLDPNVNSNEVGGAQAMSYSDKIEIKKLYQCTLSAGEEPCVVLCNMPSTYNCGDEQPGCTCGAHGSCDGESNCMCDPGFQSINNVCTQCTTTICDANAECVGPNQCACKDGFSGDGTSCTPQCTTTICDVNAECVGPDECECRDGFSGDGTTCIHFDCERDCDWLNEGCSADKTECACIEGYEYGNNECVEVAECAINQVDVHGKCRRNKWYRIFKKLNAMYEQINEYWDSYSFKAMGRMLKRINNKLKWAIGEINKAPVENLQYLDDLQVLINGFDHIGNEIHDKYPSLNMDTFWNLLADLQTAIEGRL